MTTPRDDAAIEEAKAQAVAEIRALEKLEETAVGHRARRDAAIRKMNDNGRSIPDISRDLGLPVSTVRHHIRSALARAARG